MQLRVRDACRSDRPTRRCSDTRWLRFRQADTAPQVFPSSNGRPPPFRAAAFRRRAELQQDALHDRAQTTRAGLAVDGLASNSAERLVLLPVSVRDPSYAERDELLLKRPLSVLNGCLAGDKFLVGENFTVADLNVASILAWGKMSRLDLSAHPEVTRWLDKCLSRPAYGRVRETVQV